MKKILLGAAALALVCATTVAAQPGGGRGPGGGQHANNGRHAGWGQDYGASHQWKRGQRVGYNDWNGAQVVDYRQHHLRKPPRGYEWRQSNGQYIMAAVAGGLIASIIMSR